MHLQNWNLQEHRFFVFYALWELASETGSPEPWTHHQRLWLQAEFSKPQFSCVCRCLHARRRCWRVYVFVCVRECVALGPCSHVRIGGMIIMRVGKLVNKKSSSSSSSLSIYGEIYCDLKFPRGCHEKLNPNVAQLGPTLGSAHMLPKTTPSNLNPNVAQLGPTLGSAHMLPRPWRLYRNQLVRKIVHQDQNL